MNEKVQVIFGLVGGLALFLYGMNSMSDALQKAAGERMKKLQDRITDYISKMFASGNLTGTYSFILYNMDRMADNCAAIAEEAIEHITFDKFAIDSEEEYLIRRSLQEAAAEGSPA